MVGFKVGDRITWGTKSVSFVVEKIEKGRVYFVDGSGCEMKTGEKSKFSNHSSISLYDLEFYDVIILNNDKEETGEYVPRYKVGDFVTTRGWLGSEKGNEILAIKKDYYVLADNWGNKVDYKYYCKEFDNDLILVTSHSENEKNLKSPVVTKTVKEIVPGVYGRVEVDGVYGDVVNLRILTCYGKPSGIYGFTVEDLENASKVFSDLAEYLKGE